MFLDFKLTIPGSKLRILTARKKILHWALFAAVSCVVSISIRLLVQELLFAFLPIEFCLLNMHSKYYLTTTSIVLTNVLVYRYYRAIQLVSASL